MLPSISAVWFVTGALLLMYIVVLARRWGMRTSLPGRVVLITGAGSGIGKRLAFDMYSLGCHLVLLDIRSELVSAVTKELMASTRKLGSTAGAPPRIWTYVIDVTDTSAVQALCKQIQKDVAPAHVSVLVNNAGIVVGKDILALTPEEIHRTFEVNVLAHFTMVQGFLKSMIDRSDGVIVTVSSVMGLLGAAGLSDFVASKHAAVGFTESLRFDLRNYNAKGVRCLTVCPYAVATGMFHGAFDKTHGFIHRLFLPFLSDKDVSQGIIDGIRGGYEFITVPWHFWYLKVVSNMLPSFILDPAMLFIGACSGMSTFKGRGAEWSLHRTTTSTKTD